ncbi:hypothetical protein [Pleionea litopenaei]|uniref:Uncharacterized protein n=1 Tax=Pleionea litopenaei TaxID=3070815 RepID=A0AA51RSX7_9GAMM|nr:hypothetical protein [Pleionea sp. HL-JVS1]WMS86930.1 hypothetical protein Q9312_17070 [Pleionea sp. HL-JVS1]
MSDEFNWDKALDQWQSHQPDMPALKRNMRFLAWRMKALLALDVLSLLILFPFAYFIFISNEPTSTKAWFSIICVLATVGVYFDFYLRRDLWEQPDTTHQMYLHIVKRAKAGIRIGQFSIIYLSVFLIAFASWLGFLAIYEPERFQSNVGMMSAVAALSAIFISILISFWYRQRKVKDLSEAKRQLQEFLSFDQ